MSPDSKPNDHKIAAWWRRWSGAIALALVIVGGAAGFAKIESEANTRETQFCGLVISGFEEKFERIAQTKKFLSTPNEELPQGLVGLKSYIRNVSLPQTEKEFFSEEETIPGICWKYSKRGNQAEELGPRQRQ